MGKPKNQGVTGLKAKRSLQAVAEERVGRRVANLRVLNSYWINQVNHIFNVSHF
jgi:large subunit ribosomal protein L15e